MDEGDGGEEDEDTGGRDLLGFPRACLLDSLPEWNPEHGGVGAFI